MNKKTAANFKYSQFFIKKNLVKQNE